MDPSSQTAIGIKSKLENTMKAQKPAEGILLTREYGDAMQYAVTCECGDTEHSHNIWIEAEDSNVTVTIYTTVKSKWWEANRWKQIWTLLSKGYVEYEASIIMTEQQTFNYAETLKVAVESSKKFADIRKNNNIVNQS
jgi:hypothetical protein